MISDRALVRQLMTATTNGDPGYETSRELAIEKARKCGIGGVGDDDPPNVRRRQSVAALRAGEAEEQDMIGCTLCGQCQSSKPTMGRPQRCASALIPLPSPCLAGSSRRIVLTWLRENHRLWQEPAKARATSDAEGWMIDGKVRP